MAKPEMRKLAEQLAGGRVHSGCISTYDQTQKLSMVDVAKQYLDRNKHNALVHRALGILLGVGAFLAFPGLVFAKILNPEQFSSTSLAFCALGFGMIVSASVIMALVGPLKLQPWCGQLGTFFSDIQNAHRILGLCSKSLSQMAYDFDPIHLRTIARNLMRERGLEIKRMQSVSTIPIDPEDDREDRLRELEISFKRDYRLLEKFEIVRGPWGWCFEEEEPARHEGG